MAKTRPTTNTLTTSTTNNTTTPEPEETHVPEVNTQIVPVENLTAAIDVAPAAESWMASLPKASRAMFDAMPPLDDGELQAMVSNLPETQQRAFEDLIARMNPVKLGMFVADTRFNVRDAKLYHGVGDDPGRPASAPVGSLYANNKLIIAWDKNSAEHQGVGTSFSAAVIGFYETRSWWPPRKKDFIFPAGVDSNTRGPICRSLDRKKGERFGECAACPYRPYANGKYEPDSCSDDVVLYIVMQGFSDIYRMVLKGASVKKAIQPIKRAASNLTTPWDIWFEFSLSEERNTQGRWFSVAAQPKVNRENPAGVPTTGAERGLLSALSRQVLNEVYKPELQRIYASTPVTATVEVGADMSALAASVETSDYSKNNL